MAMNLRAMLVVVRTLGKYRLIADGRTCLEDEPQLISAAARVLTDWPKNFIELLSDIGKELKSLAKGGVRKQFEPIYCALFKTRAISAIEQTGFLRAAFLDFAGNHWGRGYVDPKLLRQARGKTTSRFITRSEFAGRVGIHSRTASRLLNELKVPATRIQCGKSERILVDMSQNVFRRPSPGKIHRERNAANQLGLSVSVLRALKEGGIFEFNHHLPTKGGYHELDIEAFKTRLLSRAPAQGPAMSEANGHAVFKVVMSGHHDSPATSWSWSRIASTRTKSCRRRVVVPAHYDFEYSMSIRFAHCRPLRGRSARSSLVLKASMSSSWYPPLVGKWWLNAEDAALLEGLQYAD